MQPPPGSEHQNPTAREGSVRPTLVEGLGSSTAGFAPSPVFFRSVLVLGIGFGLGAMDGAVGMRRRRVQRVQLDVHIPDVDDVVP